MRRNALVALATCGLVAAGCQDQITPPETGLRSGSASLSVSSVPAIDRGSIALPNGSWIDHGYRPELGGRAIDPNDYVCMGNTAIFNWWLDEAIAFLDAEPALFNILYVQLFADFVVQDYATFFETEDTPQYFGYDGEYTKIMTKTDRDAKRFWDIRSDDIQLIGMHGTMLQDPAKVAAVYEFWGNPPEVSAEAAELVRDAVLASNVLDGGDHSLFSFNAFAITWQPFIPDKIIMGDGMLAGFEALGFADVAPQAIYAHEFAHHIQFENGYGADPYATTGSAAERTRYKELMADAMSAYYLTHKRGATMNRKRVEQFLEVFYQIGDCSFTASGHHGTPNQRLAAARFGFDVADQAQKKGHILSSEAFHDMFVAAYPTLIAPDAP